MELMVIEVLRELLLKISFVDDLARRFAVFRWVQ